jgi:5-carboxymethyl-2-hydroxymuconic-semialdehyde dehydrogenase
MDKITPKSDVFKANLDRAAPLLRALRADGIASSS